MTAPRRARSRVSFADWPYPALAAHRGAGRLAPENTLAALRIGHSFGYRMFEVDAKLSGDGVALLMHDATLDRTTDGRGRVDAHPFSALARLDAGSWHSAGFAGEGIPTLERVARWALANDAMLDVEIKPSPGRERESGAAVALDVREAWHDADVPPLLSSFSPAALEAAREVAPELPRALLLAELPDDWLERCIALGCVAVVADHSRLDAARIAQAHAASLRVLAYTVDEPARANELFAAGLDVLITDAVDRIEPTPSHWSGLAGTSSAPLDLDQRRCRVPTYDAASGGSRMPLSQEQLDQIVPQIRSRLTVLEEEIARKLGESAENFSSIGGPGDAGDLGSMLTETEVDLSEARRDVDEWRALRASLRRIDEGTYGVCTECGVEIPFERLAAAPLAHRCIDCQAIAEKRERTFGSEG